MGTVSGVVTAVVPGCDWGNERRDQGDGEEERDTSTRGEKGDAGHEGPVQRI